MGLTRQDAMRLWRKHGGGQHGPRVETATIPLNQFHDFVADVVSIVSAEATEAQARRIAEMEGAVKLAIDLVERDVIRVRPTEREELLAALTVWNAALLPADTKEPSDDR